MKDSTLKKTVTLYTPEGEPYAFDLRIPHVRMVVKAGEGVPCFPVYELLRAAGSSESSKTMLKRYVSPANYAKSKCQNLDGTHRTIWLVNTAGMAELLRGINTPASHQVHQRLQRMLGECILYGPLRFMAAAAVRQS